MCIWKAWKKVKTKVANLVRCGINKYQAYECGNTRKSYWRIADSPILKDQKITKSCAQQVMNEEKAWEELEDGQARKKA